MANIDNVQLPDGSSYNIVDNTSGFATQNYVDSAVSSVTKTTIGLGNVDNTSDLNKPISTATQVALDTLDEDKADKTDIATVESGTTASRAYSVGKLVYVSGTLYEVKTAIASGATFTVGTNIEVTNVSDAITSNLYLQNDFIDVYKTGNRIDVLMHPSSTATPSSGTIAQLPPPKGGRSMSNNCTYSLNSVMYDGFLMVNASGLLTMMNTEGTTQGARTYIRGMLTYYTE